MNSSTSPVLYNFRLWPNLIAAIMMITNSIFGIVFSSSIIYIYLKDNSQRTSFNLACFVRAINNIFSLLIAFILVYIPKTLLGFNLFPDWLESFLICLSLNFYLFNEFQSIYISINRFIAIYFPNQYNRFCGLRATVIVHIFIFSTRVINMTFETKSRTESKSFVIYSPELLMFTDLLVSGGGLIIVFAGMFFIALGANLFTFAKIILFYWRDRGNVDSDNRQKIRKNVKLFFQTALQDSLFFIDNYFSFSLVTLINHRFWTFICASFVWQTVHVLDGLVMILFNDRLNFLRNAFFPESVHISMADTSIVRPFPNRGLPDVG